MKCKKCGELAAINMPRHRLALCGACYLDWFPSQVQRTIDRFSMFSRSERILVAVSGGKDSLGLWDILLRLGYHADGVYVNLGIDAHDYSAESLLKVRRFIDRWASEGMQLALHVVDLKATYGRTVPELLRERQGRKPCSLCGLIKRHAINRIAAEGGYDVLATGHNLDDEAATLFQNVLNWQTDYLAHQGPVLPSIHPRLVRKVKPLCLAYERESAAYTLLRGIEYIYEECPYSVRAKTIYYKGLLDRLEERSYGAKFQFYASFLQARAEGRASFGRAMPPVDHECAKCGQPTTVPGLCAFCRIWEPKDKQVSGMDALSDTDDGLLGE